MRNQSPGPLPANLPILSTISIVIGWVQGQYAVKLLAENAEPSCCFGDGQVKTLKNVFT
jgi:hypothetical protein